MTGNTGVATATSNNKITMRPLITYALSSKYASASNGDHFAALVPLFAPIAAANKGKTFAPKAFCEEIEKTYGLKMHPFVAEECTRAMLKAGLLNKSSATAMSTVYTYTHADIPLSIESEYLEFETQLSQVFEAYETFIKSLGDLTMGAYSKEQLEDALIQWLLNSNKRLRMANDYSDKPAGDLEYVAARFVQNLEKTSPALFDSLALLASGAIVSELVLDYQAPVSVNQKARDLLVFLDAPFVMHLLGLSSKQSVQNAKFLLQQLNRLEAKIFVFPHSCDEIESNIAAVLAADNQVKHGELANALRSREVLADYANAVKSDVTKHLAKIKISVVDPKQHGGQRDQYFTDTQQDMFCSQLNWENNTAKVRDAKSLAYVMRMRSGKQDKDFLKSKCLFVTENPRLVEKARRFCVDEGKLAPKNASPVISVRTLSAILFLTLGSVEERIGLSRKQLLASCGKAIIATPDLLSAFNDKLKSFAPGQEDQILAIIAEPRVMQSVMDYTWGDPEIVTVDNISQVIQRATDKMFAEHNLKLKTEAKIANATIAGLANDNETLQKTIFNSVKANVKRSKKIVDGILLGGKIILTLALVGKAMASVIEKDFGEGLFTASATAGIWLILSRDILRTWSVNIWFDKKIIDTKIFLFKFLLKLNGLDCDFLSYDFDWKNGTVSEKHTNLV